MCLVAGLLIFAIIFINWKITEENMNQTFETNAKKLGFVKEKLYELEKDFYKKNEETIEQVLKQLRAIHKSVYEK